MSSTSLGQPLEQTLVTIARRSIEHGLAEGCALPVDLSNYPAALTTERATFVTLHSGSNLRGCIGTLEARRPLVVDVAENAYAAAFRDPRFAPVTRGQAAELALDISILSPPQAFLVVDEADLVQRLQPEVDGLILAVGQARGTFLPSVWASLPEPADFVRQLKRKAGLPLDYWSDEIRIWRYAVEKIASPAPASKPNDA